MSAPDFDIASSRATDDGTLEYVGFWVRVGASLIDTALVIALTTPLIHWAYGDTYWSNTSFYKGPADLLISYLLPIMAVLWFWIARQATPGKMLFGARIVDARTGGKPTIGQLLLRYVGYYPSIFVGFLGLMWVGWDARKQGWHDKIANTVVIRRRKRGIQPVRFDG